MDDLNLSPADDNSLAQLMDLRRPGDDPWSERELGAIWRHQLAAPLASDLEAEANAALTGVIADYADVVARRADDRRIRTFGDLMFHPQPPVELLAFVKAYAKSCRLGDDAVLPDEVATALYALSIAVAMTQCDRRISGLDDQALAHLFDWLSEQDWLDAASRNAIDLARGKLEAGDSTDGHG